MYLVLSVHTRVSKQVSVAFYAAWNRHRRLVARLTARTWYDTGRPAFIPKRDNSVQSLPAVLQRLAGRCIHRVDVYISPKYARCSVSACCWLLAERVEAHALRTLACVSRIVSLVFHLHLRVVCTSKAALEEEKEGTAWNFANRPASAFPHLPPAPAIRAVQRRLHFTTLQPITALSAAMHKVAIHPSDRVRQACASRA